MLRITPSTKPAVAMELVLEGRLAGPWVAELQTAVSAADPSGLHLDLSGVRFVDAEGLTLLLRLRDQGVVLHAVSPFVHELLNPSQS